MHEDVILWVFLLLIASAAGIGVFLAIRQRHLKKAGDSMPDRKGGFELSEPKSQQNVTFIKTLVETSLECMAVTDLDGKIIQCNQQYAGVLGYDQSEELIGRFVFDFIAQEDLERARKDTLLISNEGTIHTDEYIAIKKDGSRFNGEMSVSRIFSSEGQQELFVVITRDITDRKIAEKVLREGDVRLHFLTENTTDAIFQVDENLNIIFVNPSVERIFGYPPEMVIGKRITDSINPADIENILVTIQNAAATRLSTIRLEYQYRHFSGHYIWVESIARLLRGDENKFDGLFFTSKDLTKKKLLETELDGSRKRLGEIIDLAPFGVHIFMLEQDDRLVFTGYNRSADQILRIEHQPLVGQTIEDAFPGLIRTEIPAAYRRVVLTGEYFHSQKLTFGTEQITGVYEVHAFQTSEISVTAFLQDASETKKAQEGLRLSEQRLNLVLDATSDAVWDWHIPSGNAYFSPRYSTMLGYDPGELSPQYDTWRSLVNPADIEKAEYQIQQHLDNETDYSPEFRMKEKSGGDRWILARGKVVERDGDGKPIRMVGTHTDVTERVKSEMALRESEQRYRKIFESTTDGFILFGSQGQIIEINPAVSKLFGYDGQELIGMKGKDLFTQEYEKYFNLFLEEVVKKGSFHIDSVNQRKDHTVIYLEIDGFIFDSGSKICLAVVHNISERKQVEEEIRQLNISLERRVHERTAQLEEANKEMEAFSYSVSHDLRSPLRSMDGFSKALMEDYSDRLDDTAREYLTRIRSGSHRMSQLIDDLLKLSRVTRTEMNISLVNVSNMANEIIGELRASQPEREVITRITPDLIIAADSSLIRIVLVNLLGNSWKFTSKHPVASIELGANMDGEGKQVYFVSDDGAGFNMDYSGKLFGAFQRLHSNSEFEGTGIGLAIVHSIIRRHGGKIWAESQIEMGTTIFFTLSM